jgi:hypothetical protein
MMETVVEEDGNEWTGEEGICLRAADRGRVCGVSQRRSILSTVLLHSVTTHTPYCDFELALLSWLM